MKKGKCQYCTSPIVLGETTCQKCISDHQKHRGMIYKTTGKVSCVTGDDIHSIISRT